MFMTLSGAAFAVCAAPFTIGAATVVGMLEAGIHVFTRIASAITEPVGLLLLGVSLIGLSWLVRRRMHSGKRR